MATNDTTPQSRFRQPRGVVKIAGEACSGWVRYTTEENEFNQPDTFDVIFAMSGLPENRGPDWWATQEEVEVELFAGFPADPTSYSEADLTSIFKGKGDDVDIDWGRMVISISGRDRTADLMDAKTSERDTNCTSSDIVSKIASRRGLTPVVTSTSTKVGKFYQLDNVGMTEERTEWDLITWLARQEGFVAFVRGSELHFGPRPDASQEPYRVRVEPPGDGRGYWRSSVGAVAVRRTLMAARGVKVEVRTWNSKRKKAFTKTASRGKAEQVYRYTIPNLTPEQAQERADKLLDEISRHALTLSISGPAGADLRVDDVISLEGTGTACDQTYFPQTISRTLSSDGGYEWDITAKNKAPEQEDAAQ